MNNPHPTSKLAVISATPWLQLHQALMPDYNRKATGYWWTVVLLGTAALALSAFKVAAMPMADLVQALAGMVIAMVAGCFPVRIGRSKSSFAAGEVFIFLLLLLHGPYAATLAAGCETAVGALRTSKRWTSRIASPTISALAMLLTGSALHAGLAALTRADLANDGLTVVATMLFSLLYFTANSVLVSSVLRLKRNERLALSDWFGVFGWVGIAMAGSAAVACLLFLTYQQSGLGVLAAMLPIMAMLLATLHYYHRQEEASEAMRQATADAATRAAEAEGRSVARETEIAQQHLQQLQASEQRFQSAFTHASIGMALLSFEGQILQANDALRELLGLDDSQLLQSRFQSFVVDADRIALGEQLGRMSEQQFEDFSLELRCRHQSGDEVWVSAHCSFFSEPGSSAPCLILQAHDVSARRRAEAELHQLAFHDPLTGLPNRRRFCDLLSQAVQAAQADPNLGFAVMFLDFDRFKLINDSLGHAAGDEFLVGAARRLRGTVRPEDVVARLGGDEFAVLVFSVEHESTVITLAERMLQSLRQPLAVSGTTLTASASIGITTSLIGYESPANVLRDADIAMYRAKAAGKNCYSLFDAALHSEVKRRVRLEGELRAVIAAGQLTLAYQPMYELATERLMGFEALARWVHPELGPIGPDVFIPIAEEIGMIVTLTDFVLHRACQDLKQWQQSDPAFATLTMNVNISGKDVGHTDLVARVTHALAAARLEPPSLHIELTENILMAQLKAAMPLLAELRTLGVGLSVDDFGSGYSSLAHLSFLPVDTLKIDRSFIQGMLAESNEAAVVRAVIQLGHSLNKHVVAEGIETLTQLAQLRDMGCRAGQGFYMSRPLSASAVACLLAHTAAEASHTALRSAFGMPLTLVDSQRVAA